MAQFDPLKKPMSLQESEDLLSGRNSDEEFISFWGGLLKGIVKLAAYGVVIALVTWLCIAVPAIGWFAAAVVFIYGIGQIAQAGNKK